MLGFYMKNFLILKKGKNSQLNLINEDSHFIEFFFFCFFFLEKPFNVIDLPVLNKALVEAKQEKIKELSEAKNQDKDNSSTSSLTEPSNTSLRELDNSLNKKEDYPNDSHYKLGNHLLDSILQFLNL